MPNCSITSALFTSSLPTHWLLLWLPPLLDTLPMWLHGRLAAVKYSKTILIPLNSFDWWVTTVRNVVNAFCLHTPETGRRQRAHRWICELISVVITLKWKVALAVQSFRVQYLSRNNLGRCRSIRHVHTPALTGSGLSVTVLCSLFKVDWLLYMYQNSPIACYCMVLWCVLHNISQ